MGSRKSRNIVIMIVLPDAAASQQLMMTMTTRTLKVQRGVREIMKRGEERRLDINDVTLALSLSSDHRSEPSFDPEPNGKSVFNTPAVVESVRI